MLENLFDFSNQCNHTICKAIQSTIVFLLFPSNNAFISSTIRWLQKESIGTYFDDLTRPKLTYTHKKYVEHNLNNHKKDRQTDRQTNRLNRKRDSQTIRFRQTDK